MSTIEAWVVDESSRSNTFERFVVPLLVTHAMLTPVGADDQFI